MQHLEDRAADGVRARHALQPRLPLVIPGMNAVFAVHDVQPERQGVDHALDEYPLLSDLPHTRRDLLLQRMNASFARRRRHQEVADGCGQQQFVISECPSPLNAQGADDAVARREGERVDRPVGLHVPPAGVPAPSFAAGRCPLTRYGARIDRLAQCLGDRHERIGRSWRPRRRRKDCPQRSQ